MQEKPRGEKENAGCGNGGQSSLLAAQESWPKEGETRCRSCWGPDQKVGTGLAVLNRQPGPQCGSTAPLVPQWQSIATADVRAGKPDRGGKLQPGRERVSRARQRRGRRLGALASSCRGWQSAASTVSQADSQRCARAGMCLQVSAPFPACPITSS